MNTITMVMVIRRVFRLALLRTSSFERRKRSKHKNDPFGIINVFVSVASVYLSFILTRYTLLALLV